MTPRRQRMLMVGAVMIAVSGAVGLGLMAMQENLLYYYTPSQLVAADAPGSRTVRLGGMVVRGDRESGSLEVRLVVTDYETEIEVRYTGVLPDLLVGPDGAIREGQGIVVDGRLGDDGVFLADAVLAKHDENYMPPDIVALREAAAADSGDDAP